MDNKTKHLIELNARMHEVEIMLIEKAERIRRHLSSAINTGMDDYRTFVIEGIICIEPSLETPHGVIDKMDALGHAWIVTMNDTMDESKAEDYLKESRNWGTHYGMRLNDAPNDYIPLCHAYKCLIEDNQHSGKLDDELLAHINPDCIQDYITIHI